MFSPSIQSLLDESGVATALKRAEQIQNKIEANKASINTTTPPTLNASNTFAQVLKASEANSNELNYKVNTPAPASKAQILNMIKSISAKHGVDEKLVMAVVKQESGFRSDAVSKSGALGLMQLMPKTAEGLGVKDAMNPIENINGGVKHLKYLLKKYNGNVILALAAYNSGTGTVAKYNGVPPYKETQNYVRNILANYLG